MFVRYAFLADSVSVDVNGKLNAMGIFERIFARKFPALHREMVLVARFEGTVADKGTHKITVEIRDGDANPLGSREQTIELKSLPGIHGNVVGGLVLRLRDFVFKRAGQYEVVIFDNNRFLCRVTFLLLELQIKEAGEE
jgi:hypothetical protein